MMISGPNMQTLFRVSQARSNKPTKPTLQSLKVEPFGDGVNIAATDGWIVACAHLSKGLNYQVTDPVEALIPGQVLDLMKPAHFAKSWQAIALELVEKDENQTWNYFANGSMTSLTLPKDLARYPQWQKVMPSAEAFEKLDRIPNHGFCLDRMKKANAILGEKKYPFNLNCALMIPGTKQAVAHSDGVLVITLADEFPADSVEGPKLAILDNAKAMGFISAK